MERAGAVIQKEMEALSGTLLELKLTVTRQGVKGWEAAGWQVKRRWGM